MLQYLRQEDFAAGCFQSVARHLIPENGAYDLVNLLLDNDGSIYKRGGTQYQSSPAFGSTLTWVWDGYLAAGRRTVMASSTAFGVLAANDTTPVNLGGAGLLEPVRAVEIGGMLFIEGGVIYAGSLKAADYSTGTIAVTNGSTTVTGTGTSWSANVDAGMLLRIGGAGRYYVVSSVNSNVQLTLTEPFTDSTASGLSYALTRLGSAAAPYKSASVYATAGTRLVACTNSRVELSAGTSDTGLFQPFSFPAGEYHELPGGSRILGAATIRDTLIVFSTSGAWSISNLSLDLTDPVGNAQHRVEQISADLILWGKAGIAEWRNALIVPTTNNVYLVDGISAPRSLSDAITGLLTRYVRTGYKVGGAVVFNNCYFLPILDATNVPVDMLVCRLDRRVSSRLGDIWPWTRLSGHAMSQRALTARKDTTAVPKLLGAGVDARVSSLSGMFAPTAAIASDADATAFRYRVDTRDFLTGTGNSNLVRRLKARYELVGSAALAASYSVGEAEENTTKWDAFLWDTGTWADDADDEYVPLSGFAPPDVGRSPYTWLNWEGRRTRYIRGRIESSDPATSFVLRSIEWAVRPSGKEE